MRLRTIITYLFPVMLMSCNNTIQEDAHLLENLMKSKPGQFEHILENKDKYDVQIIYTQINRDSNNVPSFRSFYFNTDENRYFYPASTVKLPVALLALEKLNEIKLEGLTKSTTMLTDSAFSGQTPVTYDSSSATGLPSIGHYLKKIFVVSDNDAFNRIYEFVGQEEINKKLLDKGYDDSRIITRLSIFLNEEENRNTNPIRFVNNDTVIYSQEPQVNTGDLPLKETVLKGKGYIRNGELVSEPFDFTKKNFIPLEELQLMLRSVFFPEYVEEKHRFNLSESDYKFLYQYMSQLPSETSYPDYDTTEFYDAYGKLLMYGNDTSPIPENIRIFNKYGQSYGYLIDNAYIIDTDKNIEFMLSAVIQTNENDIYNDNIYEYDEIGYPFMRDLGQLIYNYEADREREHAPNLSKFLVSYDKVMKVSESLHKNLFQNYSHYHIPELDYRKITRSDIEPFINELRTNPEFEVTKLGESVEGREINLVKLGSGPTKVLLWSQMHGNESTATRALFEIFNFLSSDDELNEFKETILKNTTLYFIPMLNPDGAEKFMRRNALSIDLNRDALRLTSPEAKILKETRDKYEPEYGFNLHDQSKYYNVYRTGKTASISFLAPAFNYEKDINDGRANAMKLIVTMNEVLQQYIPGNVGKYDDAFEPRAFGDNIQKWGTNTILIESGGYPNDPEKKLLVKMNFISILHALHQIADGDFDSHSVEDYFNIPDNDMKFFDLIIRNGLVSRNDGAFKMDIGINLYESGSGENDDLSHSGMIEEVGHLINYYGYSEFDADGMVITPGNQSPTIFKNINEISSEQAYQLLSEGYTVVRVKELPSPEEAENLPLQIVGQEEILIPAPDLGNHATFLLRKNDKVTHVVINGKIIDLEEWKNKNSTNTLQTEIDNQTRVVD